MTLIDRLLDFPRSLFSLCLETLRGKGKISVFSNSVYKKKTLESGAALVSMTYRGENLVSALTNRNF